MTVVLLLMPAAAQDPAVERLAVGETFTIESAVLGETRRINVYRPPAWGEAPDAPRPVLYMPDGGIAEDFLHVAGLLQVSTGNGSMRPFLLVGIENTDRRRDMTAGSAAFRRFIRDELMPRIDARYRTTGARAIVGESLAGLFVVETLFAEPELFDTYVAFDPSLWWNDGALLGVARTRLQGPPLGERRLFLASSSDGDRGDAIRALVSVLEQQTSGLRWTHQPMPGETHATIYHPAALLAFRALFKPGL